MSTAWGLRGDLRGRHARELILRLFRCFLAIGHAPTYQNDHAEALAQDWARFPIPASRALFEGLADAGSDVAVLTNLRPNEPKEREYPP